MKTTYLVFENGIGSALRVATKDEWNRIMAENRGVSTDKRRYFIKDCFEDNGVIDCLYYEATKDAFDEWHREKERHNYRHRDDSEAVVLSLDVSTQTADGSCLADALSDGTDWESVMVDTLYLREFRVQLAAWREWANELFDYYLAGEQMAATKIMARKYGLSEQLIRRRKRELETFIKKYFNF